jgi:hypothetical protein
MPTRTYVLSLAGALLAACGGTTVLSSGSTGGSPPSDGGGCIHPTEGQPCTPDQTACSDGNPCSTGEWTCDQGTMTWGKVVPICDLQAPNCGPLWCMPGSYCLELGPGVAAVDGGTPSPSYACTALPASCLASPSCACIEASLPAGSECTCTQDGSGLVTVHCPEA